MKINLLLLCVLLCGCATKPKVVTVTEYKITPVACEEPALAQPIKLLPVKWIKAHDDDGLPVIALSPDHYENISKNIAILHAAIKRRIAIANYYKSCIAEHNK